MASLANVVRFTFPQRGEVAAPTGPREARPDGKLRAAGEGARKSR